MSNSTLSFYQEKIREQKYVNRTKRDCKTAIYRLRRLSEYLRDDVPSKRFDLRNWGERKNWGDKRPPTIQILDNECGTTACACGFATTIPEFRKLGLGSKFNEEYMIITYNKFLGWAAIWRFFKLTLSESMWLFSPESYNEKYSSKAYVIRRIESKINKLEKELKNHE